MAAGEALGFDHVDLTVNDLARSVAFYAKVLAPLGFRQVPDPSGVDFANHHVSIGLKVASGAAAFDRFRVGLHHVALRAANRADVDAFHRFLVCEGVTILDPPADYPEYGDGYYAVFFTDPDGLKLELVHWPWGYWQRTLAAGAELRARHAPSLETERLVLRPFALADADAYALICADPEVMRWVRDGQPLTRAAAWRSIATYLGHWQLRGYGFWALEEKATGRLVGRAGLWNPEGWPGIEVGWLLARDVWGRGYATEAARAALDFAFDRLDAAHVVSVIHPENARSIRVAERLGERCERTMVVEGDGGRRFDVVVYGVAREAWRAARRGSDGAR